jgi:dTDP-glucose pyrophosphorylase
MDIRPFLTQPDISILDVMATIDANRRGVAIVVDKYMRMMGVITDGDIRRAIMAGVDLSQPVSILLARRNTDMYPQPISAQVGISPQEILKLMRSHKIRHLPILDESGKVVELALFDDLLEAPEEKLTAVVMAGGFGKRLHPLTNELPKPMLPLNGKPIMERQIEQLQASGIHQVYITTHYKSEKIVEHFRNGDGFGVEINYIQESEPLGTAGSLGLLPETTEPILVINGDILTRLDFGALFVFHKEHEAEMTIAVREFKSQVPYGVVEVNGIEVVSVNEKPTNRYFVNAGIYLLNASVVKLIPGNGEHYDMPDLINTLVRQCRRVVCFPIREYWMDIGYLDDYERAKADLANGRF